MCICGGKAGKNEGSKAKHTPAHLLTENTEEKMEVFFNFPFDYRCYKSMQEIEHLDVAIITKV